MGMEADIEFMNITSWRMKIGGALLAVGNIFATLSTPWWIWKLGAAMISIGGILLGTGRTNSVPSESVPKAAEKAEEIKADTAFLNKPATPNQ